MEAAITDFSGVKKKPVNTRQQIARRLEARGRTLKAKVITPVVERMVLDMLAKGHTVTYSCAKLDVCRVGFYNHKKAYPEFTAAVNEAEEAGVQMLEEEARRRGADGVDEPVVYQGALSYRRDPRTGELELDEDGDPIPLTVKRYSDNLLMFVTKARDRARYADRHELTGADGAALHAPVTSENALECLLQRLDKMDGRVTLTLEKPRRGNGDDSP